MVSTIISWLASLVINIISSASYFGVFFLMVLESACIPVPSEIIMPFSGFLVFSGKFIFWKVILWGTIGNLVGSILAYFVGLYAGRPMVEKYGKYILISRRDLDLADRWFSKYGQRMVFFSRLLPGVRTFISLPAGIARMDFKKFCFYTLIGCLIWSFLLTYIGLKMGENWTGIRVYFEKFDYIIALAAVIIVIWWIGRHTGVLKNKS
jgi:membrane protein DedA with SNARE-associated domain